MGFQSFGEGEGMEKEDMDKLEYFDLLPIIFFLSIVIPKEWVSIGVIWKEWFHSQVYLGNTVR